MISSPRIPSDEDNAVPLFVTLVDVETGAVRRVGDGEFRPSLFCWTVGNWSCDCNREDFFGEGEEVWQPRRGCIGGRRYVVVAVNPMPESYTLADFNDDYSSDVVERAMAIYQARAA